MKKTIIIILAIIVLGVASYFVVRIFLKKDISITIQPSPSSTYKLPSANDFQWGINTSPNGLAAYTPETWQQQIDIIKKLGARWIRMGWEAEAGTYVYVRENEVFGALWKNGINIILGFGPAAGWEKPETDTYNEGYLLAKQISSYYKGRIPIYQILNEGDAMTVISQTSSGELTTDFDPAKVAKIKGYLEGASKGLREGDPAAKTVITTVCTQTGYLDLIASDSNIKFDYVGLDWYNWCDPIGSKKRDDGKTLVVTKLKSYGKPMIITEANAWPKLDEATGKSTIVDEDLQASTISDTAEWAYANKDWVKGFYVFSLFDDKFSDNPLYFGIYGTQRNGHYSAATVPKKAYNIYQAIIAKYSK